MTDQLDLSSLQDPGHPLAYIHRPFSVPTSITHAHLLRVVLSEATSEEKLNILDAGCGNGRLLLYLQQNLGSNAVCYGFDVADHGVQPGDFFRETRALLDSALSDIHWSDRLFLIESTMPWPFAEGTFNFIVANQVLEHVWDLDLFLTETARVLRPGGQLVTLFPTRRVIYEGHVGVPFAHQIRDTDLRKSVIGLCQRLGLDRGRAIRDTPTGNYTQAHSDYVDFLTRYRTFDEIADAAVRAGLRISHRYTPHFYWLKLRSLAKRPLPERYQRTPAPVDAALFQALQFVSGVTLTFERGNEYDADSHTHKLD